MVKELWEKIIAYWKEQDLHGKVRVIVAALFILLVLISAFFGGKAAAAEKLGPNVPVTHYYVVPALTIIDSQTVPTGILGIRHNWSPVDLVGEVVIRDAGALHLMVARTWGDNRVVGGLALQSGTSTPGLVFGVDVNRFIIRVNAFNTHQTGTAPAESYRRCESPPTPTVVETTRGHSAISIGYSFPL